MLMAGWAARDRVSFSFLAGVTYLPFFYENFLPGSCLTKNWLDPSLTQVVKSSLPIPSRYCVQIASPQVSFV